MVQHNESVRQWVDQFAEILQPDRIEWADGSQEEWDRLTQQLVDDGTFIRLNPEKRPNSFLARTDPTDVARVEDRTFICSKREADAGPTNNWRDPDEMRAELKEAFTGAMRGRTMYVIPFSMGPFGGDISKVGIQLTDSPYVVVSMHLMTRVDNDKVAEQINAGAEWVPAVHSVGHPLRDEAGNEIADVPWPCSKKKYIVQFPETREIWSFGSGYGGNALLGKKCYALRIASAMGRDQGWLAEHMLLIRATSPAGRSYHITAAFPSACGKTNFAMMRPTLPGWKVETLGDDIVWMRPKADGRLYAINPENGFFGVAPGTGVTTNPNAIEALSENVIFTNVALTDDGDVWWEGLTEEVPEHLTDWRGREWTPASETTAAHPNSRFTVRADQAPSLADDWDAPEGVPVDAILFGGRRRTNTPLVVESNSWRDGVYIGATMASEQTAAAEGTVGQLRRDPFAMLPFCGYNMADYWGHWLEIGETLGEGAPRIFGVNWFRRSADGSFLWPGFGDNSRVIDWIAQRLDGDAEGESNVLGVIPRQQEFALEGTDVTDEDWQALFALDPKAWLHETDDVESYFKIFGSRVPVALRERLGDLQQQLEEAADH
ncbi:MULTISPECIES: phosphoenolpyruvate carboxykinase (GTP) [unclassified Pseudoclavibacter]|uniref:phosphoenolpyruvate carboxykinase (GTP) n=1 Tax=unclassified Pseudoclavibacter TaxID=2615177 RepID=UPI00130191A8|nr:MULTISPECIES: phosphoenolpyruvate carboxykinase (GTP) [unclassified Pseudoclavibacter]KAB1644439.1 phosphoenolpyruvate carboxykinase (GTP) [Pseudoclavibacter sp. CFCC 14310]KAB1664058.1 phosphoenolpyruvate carboxykinase (GTP) [Pseudoclavibacter sp. CFCC 13611]